jgi:hypothetical protein
VSAGTSAPILWRFKVAAVNGAGNRSRRLSPCSSAGARVSRESRPLARSAGGTGKNQADGWVPTPFALVDLGPDVRPAPGWHPSATLKAWDSNLGAALPMSAGAEPLGRNRLTTVGWHPGANPKPEWRYLLMWGWRDQGVVAPEGADGDSLGRNRLRASPAKRGRCSEGGFEHQT